MSGIAKEFADYKEQISNVNNTIDRDIIKSLKSFSERFQEKRENFEQKKKDIYEHIKDIKNNVEINKNEYFKHAEIYDNFIQKCKDATYIEDNEYKKGLILNELNQEKDEAMLNYKESIKKGNMKIECEIKESEALSEIMLQYDETRIEMFKDILFKYIDFLKDLKKSFSTTLVSIKGIIEHIAPQSDVLVFLSTCKNTAPNPLFEKIPFEEYSYKSQINDHESFILTDKVESIENNFTKKINCLMKTLLDDTVILPMEYKISIMKNMKDPEIRQKLCKGLSKIVEPLSVKSTEAFNNIGDIIDAMLTCYVKNNNHNEKNLSIVITAAENIYITIDSKTKFLYSLIAQNVIWQDIDMWENLIEIEIGTKIEYLEDKLNIKKSNTNKKVKKLTKVEEEKQQRIKVSSAHQILIKYSSTLPKFGLKSELSKKLIRHFGKTYNIGIEKICELEYIVATFQPFDISNLHRKKKSP